MVTITTSSVSWLPSTSMNYVSKHTNNDNIKRYEQYEPGINSFANDCKIIYKIVIFVLFSISFS